MKHSFREGTFVTLALSTDQNLDEDFAVVCKFNADGRPKVTLFLVVYIMYYISISS